MTAQRAIEIDDSRHPLVIVTFTGVATDAEFRDYLAGMTEMLQRRQVNAVILDSRRAAQTPPVQRKLQADWLKEHEPLLRRYSAGTAFIITSGLIRGILTAILWLQPLAGPHTVVATMEEAERWCAERLREHGLTMPSRRRTG